MDCLATLDDKYPVERSRLLDVFDFSQYTPDEMLLLDVYLSKINPKDPETKRVQFRKKEYELFLERGKQKTTAFKKAALGLFGKFIDPDHVPEDIEFDPRHIWKELSFKKDKTTNEWVFTMECDAKAEPFFFNTQKYGFIRYLVGYIKNFTSKHSFLLYYYFKRKQQEEARFHNPIMPTIAELKKITGTTGKKTYKEFKYFRRDVIDKALEEISSYTDIDVTYEVVKVGRRIDRIHFHVADKKFPPLLKPKDAQPSEELKGLFAKELEDLQKAPVGDEDKKVQIVLPDGSPAWIDMDVLCAIMGQTQEMPSGDGGQAKRGEGQVVEDLSAFERDLLATIPEEVHGGDINRVRGVLSVVNQFITEACFLDFLEPNESGLDFDRDERIQRAREAALEDYYERVLEAIRSFNVREYNVRRDGVSSPYAYYVKALEGWLVKRP